MTGLLIRSEEPGEELAIGSLITSAFLGTPYSNGTEAEVVARLRSSGGLSLSLVAVADGHIVGHVAFSPVVAGDGSSGWFGLGPVAVAPERQRQGIGSALIQSGLGRLEGQGCVVVGDPGYYRRFGFVPSPDHSPLPELAEHFQVWPDIQRFPPGPVRFHPAFGLLD